MSRQSDAEDKAALDALVRLIKTNPRLVREALELATDEDRKAAQHERDDFEAWRNQRIKSQRDRGLLP